MKAFKFIAEQTPVPDVGVYSGCATVVIANTVEEARTRIHSWGRDQSTPKDPIDTRWVDFAPHKEIEIADGAVLLFVMQ